MLSSLAKDSSFFHWKVVKRVRSLSLRKLVVTHLHVIVSFLPSVDIVIVAFLQESMYSMLACFSVDPSPSLNSFKTVHQAQQEVDLGVRGATLLVGGLLPLSVNFYLVGSSFSLSVAATATALLGWTCYRYFTD